MSQRLKRLAGKPDDPGAWAEDPSANRMTELMTFKAPRHPNSICSVNDLKQFLLDLHSNWPACHQKFHHGIRK